MPENNKSPLDPYKDVLGVDLAPERLIEILASYRDILVEIRKLRELDLTEVHPAVVFDAAAGYPRGKDR